MALLLFSCFIHTADSYLLF